jgi:hypothetical protein
MQSGAVCNPVLCSTKSTRANYLVYSLLDGLEGYSGKGESVLGKRDPALKPCA